MSDDDPIGHTFVTRDDIAAIREAVRAAESRFRRIRKQAPFSKERDATEDVFTRLNSLLVRAVHAVEHFELNKLDPECFWCQSEKDRHEANMRDMPAYHRKMDAERCLICRIESKDKAQ